jgi:hypothetical protein
MSKNYHLIARGLDKKLKEDGHITQEDVTSASEVARATGKMEYKVLFASLKKKLDNAGGEN